MSRVLSAEELEARAARRLNGEPVRFVRDIPPEPEPEPPPAPEPEPDPLPGALDSLNSSIKETAEMNAKALAMLAEKLAGGNAKRKFHAKFIRNEKNQIEEAIFTEL